MRILEKQGDEISIVALPSESVFQGDYLEIIDSTAAGSVVVQVYDEMYIPSQSLTEDIIQDQIIEASAYRDGVDPFEISSVSQMIKDMRLLKCKIRGSIQNGLMVPNVAWVPSRYQVKDQEDFPVETPGPLGSDGEREDQDWHNKGRRAVYYTRRIHRWQSLDHHRKKGIGQVSSLKDSR